MAPRWRKVLADLWGSKTRTLLTALTIAVGVFAVGLVNSVGSIVMSDMDTDYQASHPHVAVVYTSPFDDDLLRVAREVPGVAGAEGRGGLTARMLLPGRQVPVEILGIPPLDEMRIDRLRPAVSGENLALGERELLVERTALAALGIAPGDRVQVELPDGRVRELRLAGAVHDVDAPPFAFVGSVYAYATLETLEWLGEAGQYTAVYLTVTERPTDTAHVSAVAQAVADQIEKRGWTVYQTFVYQPGRHFAADITQGVMTILGVLGVLTVFLSMFLVVNTITGLLSQHVRQIGVMKAVGARMPQVAGMYATMVLVFGLLALIVALPLAAVAAYAVAGGLSQFLNFDLRPFRIPPDTVAWQAGVALLVPLAAALVPVLGAARLTVREAISNYGLGKDAFGRSALDRALERVRFLSRPLLISLRNTFRRKGRLALTLSTLTLGGAIFIAVFNLWAAFAQDLVAVQGYFLADINVGFTRMHFLDEVSSVALGVPGVTGVEGWAVATGQVLSPDKSTAVDTVLFGPPADSTLIEPVLRSGRWLVPEDENAIVVGNHLLKVRPDVKVGDDLVIKIEDRETAWRVVGVYELAGNVGQPILYANYEYLSRVVGEPGMVSDLRVITSPHDAATQTRVLKELEVRYKRAGIRLTGSTTGEEWRAQQTMTVDVLIYFLLTMAMLIGLVGGLGLMGTMSMNVLERIREIGVMRAIGASNGAVLQLVIVEGVLIGAISWGLGLLLSVPITGVLNYGVGFAVLTAPLAFTFGWNGVALWLGVVLGVAALASAVPAWNAMRLTVRDVLAYE